MAISPAKHLRRSRPAPASPAGAPAEDDYGSPGRPEWLDVDWSRHLRSVVVHDTRVGYVEMGEGPPIVFVHGLSGCWQNWLENILHFARTHRVIAVDLPGFGDSELPNEDISIPGYGRFLDAFLSAVDIDRAMLVGNSMGGFIAAETAISHPSRVEGLVLVSAVGGVSPVGRVTRAQARLGMLTYPLTPAFMARRTALMRRPRLRGGMLLLVVRYPTRIRPELVWEVSSGAGKPGFVAALRALMDYDFRDRLPDVSCPTLIVWGRNDQVVPVRGAHEYERLIPGARKVIFDQTGHVPMLERPARFNRVLDEFLEARVSG